MYEKEACLRTKTKCWQLKCQYQTWWLPDRVRFRPWQLCSNTAGQHIEHKCRFGHPYWRALNIHRPIDIILPPMHTISHQNCSCSRWGVFKPNSRNRKTRILSKLLWFQPNFSQWLRPPNVLSGRSQHTHRNAW